MKIISSILLAFALSVGTAHAENKGDAVKFSIGDSVMHKLDKRVGFVVQIHTQTNSVSHMIGERDNKETFFVYVVRFRRHSFDAGVTVLYPLSSHRNFELVKVK